MPCDQIHSDNAGTNLHTCICFTQVQTIKVFTEQVDFRKDARLLNLYGWKIPETAWRF